MFLLLNKFLPENVIYQMRNLSYALLFICILLILSFAPNFSQISGANDIFSIFTNTNNFTQMIFFLISFISESFILILFGFVLFDKLTFFVIVLMGLSLVSILILRNNEIFVYANEYYNIPILTSLGLCIAYKTISMNDLKKIEKTI